MQLTPEIKAQLEEQKKQCIFCRIVSGEIQARKVFEDDKTLAFLDIYPVRKGHTIFLPKEHYPLMPYLPPDDFRHFFGLLPGLTKAIKSAMVATASNIFIANGSAAGQQGPHFILHLLPRDAEDGFFNFLLEEKKAVGEQETALLAQNFPAIMSRHFQENPAPWHSGAGERPAFLQNRLLKSAGKVLYEDEKALVLLPARGAAPGHLQVFSKGEEKLLENLPPEDSTHLFSVVSAAAALLFEGLRCQGTNIVVKSGHTEDNPMGMLCFHILPRREGDGLEKMLWKPQQPKYDLDEIAAKIKDRTWAVAVREEKAKPGKSPLVKEEKIQGNAGNETEHEIAAAIGQAQK